MNGWPRILRSLVVDGIDEIFSVFQRPGSVEQLL